jgi:hypothetical protein
MICNSRFTRIDFRIFLFQCLIFFLPGNAEATQIHPAEEGLYVHQIGHLFFILSMGFLIYRLRQRHLTREAGWRCIQYSALFFILWNVDAGIVHFFEDREDIYTIIDAAHWHHWIDFAGGHTSIEFFYYLGRMDHLLCVPAVIFLYCGLKHLLKQSESSETMQADRL